jgi:nucleoside-diphosphate-sugar epimerase
MAASNHAIVYGASGLIGWAIANQLLNSYPHAGAFSKFTTVTNRPLNLSETFWPESDSRRPELQVVSGVDIGHDDEAAVANALKSAVKDIETVTHVFYLGMHYRQRILNAEANYTVFAASGDHIEEVAINRRMFLNVLRAHNVLSPSLQFVEFAGGTRVSIIPRIYRIFRPN